MLSSATSLPFAASDVDPPAPSARRHLIRLDPREAFCADRIQSFRHTYHEHPLFELPALAELAKRLAPTRQCRFIRRGATQSSRFHHVAADPDGRDIDEVFRRIEEPGSWISLYNIETEPAYGALLQEIIDAMRGVVEPQQPGVYQVCGYLFISAPPSVTPFHIDRENNFWLQLRGRKTMSIWDHRDRDVVAAEDVERFVVRGSLDKVRLDERFRARARDFDVGPGDGVYFPSTSPHMTRSDPGWTRPGDGVSISVGVVFYTAVTRRIANAHVVNAVARRFGVRPTEPGLQAWRDRAKHPVGRALVWAMNRFRGYEPQMGMLPPEQSMRRLPE
ncbi:MAG TPA: cupin domain-containing protein [Burkholderiaceae bacterium]|nr:cupin domain-containing protein [Burkholderiaceae bacterium]